MKFNKIPWYGTMFKKHTTKAFFLYHKRFLVGMQYFNLTLITRIFKIQTQNQKWEAFPTGK